MSTPEEKEEETLSDVEDDIFVAQAELEELRAKHKVALAPYALTVKRAQKPHWPKRQRSSPRMPNLH